MNKRLEMLEKMAAAGKADAFALYALAIEYRNAERNADALRTFETLRAKDEDYLPMYLMAGKLLSELGRIPEAREWLEAGIDLATTKSDGKAKSELMSALAECD